MQQLKVGYAVSNIDPMIGIELEGYYQIRKCEGIKDSLEVTVLALECGSKRVALITLDLCLIQTAFANRLRAFVSEATGLAKDEIYVSCTHTHTAPYTRESDEFPLEQAYGNFLIHRVADAVRTALADLAPAKMGFRVGEAKNVAFLRRYRMKDGSIRTNPGVNNPDIVAPIGEVDERVNVLRFDREGADTVVLVNFGNHPDVVGGNLISGDWPSILRRTVEKSLDNVRCIFFNGAQGDVNHVNVHPKDGDLNQMFIDFDDVARGHNHAQHIARVVTGAVLQVFDKVKYVEANDLSSLEKTIHVPSNKPTPEEMPEARRIHELHEAGRDAELPYKGMMLTTMVAQAARMVNLEHAPDAFPMNLIGVKIGPVALIGIPGEPFTGVGQGLKTSESFELVCPSCITGGYEGYFPMQDSYSEGGYEAGTSRFKAGCAEYIVKEGKQLLAELSKL